MEEAITLVRMLVGAGPWVPAAGPGDEECHFCGACRRPDESHKPYCSYARAVAFLARMDDPSEWEV